MLQPVIASKLLRHMGQQRGLSSTEQPVMYEALTEREIEVLALLAQGMPNKEIAAHLTISERTAKFHVSSIMGKLGATNRTEAVSLAAQKGLITLRSRVLTLAAITDSRRTKKKAVQNSGACIRAST